MAKQAATATQKPPAKKRGRKKPEDELKELVALGLLTKEEQKKLKDTQGSLGKKSGAIGFLAYYKEQHGRIQIPKPDQYADIADAIAGAVEQIREKKEAEKKGSFKLPRSGFRVTMGKQTEEMKKEGKLPKPIVKAL
jgi:hypothetical protein